MKHLKFIVPLLALCLILPVFVTKNYYQMLLCQAFINIIVVLGLNFITGLTGQMNLGTAGIFAIGAYISALLSVNFSISPWICLLLAIGAGYLIGRGLGYPSLRVKGVYLALTTMGFGEIIRLLATNLENVTGGNHGVNNIPGFNFFGIQIDDAKSFYYFLLIFTVIMVVISLRIINSKWGRAFKAIRDNIDAVEGSGIDVADIKIKAFTIAAIYGCIGGALYANLMGYINPTGFSLDFSFSYLIMLMLGGIGTVGGSILGAILVTILPEFLRFLQDYYMLIFGVIGLLFAIFMPYGLISIVRIPFEHRRMNTDVSDKNGKG